MTILVLPLLATLACASEPEGAGTITVALVATGSDGSTYRLPAGTMLDLFSTTFFDELSLDGDVPSIGFDVPPGDYQAELFHPDGHTTVWPLEHLLADGSTETVNATLVTAMPAAITVIADETVDLVLSFRVAGGTITFDHGTISVSVDVDEVEANGGQIGWNGTMTASAPTVGATAPPSLIAALPAAGASGLGLGFTAHTVGPWVKSSTTAACAPLDAEVAATGNAALADLAAEASTGTGILCVTDNGDGTSTVQVTASRIGAATTATFAGLGPSTYRFTTSLVAEYPVPVLVGDDLDLDALAGTRPLATSVFTRVEDRSGPSPILWYRGTYFGPFSFDFTPTP